MVSLVRSQPQSPPPQLSTPPSGGRGYSTGSVSQFFLDHGEGVPSWNGHLPGYRSEAGVGRATLIRRHPSGRQLRGGAEVPDSASTGPRMGRTLDHRRGFAGSSADVGGATETAQSPMYGSGGSPQVCVKVTHQ